MENMLETERKVHEACKAAGLDVTHEYRVGDPWRAYLISTKSGKQVVAHEDYVMRDPGYLQKIIEFCKKH